MISHLCLEPLHHEGQPTQLAEELAGGGAAAGMQGTHTGMRTTLSYSARLGFLGTKPLLSPLLQSSGTGGQIGAAQITQGDKQWGMWQDTNEADLSQHAHRIAPEPTRRHITNIALHQAVISKALVSS
jgi:hypothetical protein